MAISDWYGKLTVFTVLGDAEAFVFDWSALSPAQQSAFVAKNLAAFKANIEKKGKPFTNYVPIALVGESMPGAVQSTVDLSAPHEGTLLLVPSRGGSILYVSAADDPCAWLAYENEAKLGLRGSFRDEPYDMKSMDFGGEPTKKTGFSLDQWKMATGGLAMVIGQRGGLFGIIERLRASS